MNDATPRTAVNQAPGGGTDYPFPAENDLAGRVLDVYLSYADPECSHDLPFSLTVAGTTYTVRDAGGTTVAAGDAGDADTTVWGDRTVYQWVGEAAVLRVVVRTDLIADGSGALDPRTANRVAGRVESLAVSTDVSGTRRKTGDVALANGYNTTLTYLEPALTDGGRYVRQVRLDVSPAAGLGRAPGCEELEPVVRSVNNVRAAAGGNVVLTAGGGQDDGRCFRIYTPTAITATSPRTAGLTHGANTVRISSDCAPCCTCTQYVRTYEGLRRMVSRWQSLVNDAQSARDVYAANRERWIAQRSCRLNRPLRATAGSMAACLVPVSAAFCNMSRTCLKPLELRITVDAGEVIVPEFYGPAFVSGSSTNGDEKYVPAVEVVGGKVTFVTTFPYADPQSTSQVRFRVKIPGCTDGMVVKVTATAHADADDTDLPVVDDGSPWGSDYTTRAEEVVFTPLVSAPAAFCEGG